MLKEHQWHALSGTHSQALVGTGIKDQEKLSNQQTKYNTDTVDTSCPHDHHLAFSLLSDTARDFELIIDGEKVCHCSTALVAATAAAASSIEYGEKLVSRFDWTNEPSIGNTVPLFSLCDRTNDEGRCSVNGGDGDLSDCHTL